VAARAGSTTIDPQELRLPGALVADLLDASSLRDVWALTLAGAPHAAGVDGVRVAELTMSPSVGYRVLAQGSDGPDLASTIMRSPLDHPIIAHYVRSRFTTWVSLADLLPGRRWLEHPLYRDVYRPAGMRAQISCALSDTGPMMVSLSMTRAGRDFSSRERARLGEYRRVVAVAYHRVATQVAQRQATRALEQSATGSGLVAVLAPDDGRIVHLSPALSDWSRRHPAVLEQVLAGVRNGVGPVSVQRGDVTVHAAPTATSSGLVVTVSESASYRLTAREAQVLAALAEGLTAHAIAHRLGTREATVRKHLEHVYAKLGVSDRLAAVTLARDHRLVPPAL
jgi:DNA-binding CsgD family transcriptional regulator